MFSQACVKNSVRGGMPGVCLWVHGGVCLWLWGWGVCLWFQGCVSASGSRRCTPPPGWTSPLSGRHIPRQTPPLGRHPPQADSPQLRWPLQRMVRILLECIHVSAVSFFLRPKTTRIKRSTH